MLIQPLQNVQTPQRFTTLAKPTPLAHPVVELVGRRTGIIPFFLGLFGLKSTARLVVTRDEVNCETRTFTRTTVEMIPLSRVADVHVAEFRSLATLIFGAWLTIAGTIGYFSERDSVIVALLMVLVGLAFIVAYFLKRRMLISVYSESGYPMTVVVESGRIKGRLFTLSDLIDIQRMIRQLVAGQVPSDEELSTYSSDDDSDDDGDESDANDEESTWRAPAFEAPRQPSRLELEQLARRMFDEARQRSRQGDRDGAVQLLRQLIADYPETTQAEQARAGLVKIGLRP